MKGWVCRVLHVPSSGVLTRIFAVASGRKSTGNLFGQVTELMVIIDHENVRNSTSPPFAFPSYLFHMGISFPLGQLLTREFWSTYGCETIKFFSFANAAFVYI